MIKSRFTSLGRRRVAAIAITALAGLALGGVFVKYNESGPDAIAAGNEPAPADAEVDVISQMPDGAHVFTMLWQNDAVLWYVTSEPAGGLFLHRYQAQQAAIESWPVPGDSAQTSHTYLVEQAGTGKLWVGANYAVAVFDPEALRFVAAFELDKTPADAVQQTGYPAGGAWLNGMVASPDGGVFFTRHGVSATYQITEQGGVGVARRLEKPAVGLRVVSGEVEAVVAAEGGFVANWAGTKADPAILVGTGCSLTGVETAERAELSAGSEVLARGLAITPEDPIAIDGNQVKAALGIGTKGFVLVADCEARTLKAVSLGSDLVWVDGFYDGPDSSEPLRVPRKAETIAVSETGRLAAATSAGDVIVIRE